MAHRRNTGGRLLTIVIVLFVASSLLPTKWSRWAGWFADPMAFFVQPIAHPVMRLTRSLLPKPAEPEHDNPQLRELTRQRDEVQLLYRQSQLRINQLQQQVRDLQSGVPVAPGAHVRQLWAPVTARSSSLRDGVIRIGAGENQQVIPDVSVATSLGVNLIGRVIEVDSQTSWILPFNHSRAGHITGVVIAGPTLEESFNCQLHARGDGLLTGDMVADAVGIEPGQTVRLRDDSWPASAQMLILGRVVHVDHKENQRLVVVVKPNVAPDRVSEVVLRISESADEGATR